MTEFNNKWEILLVVIPPMILMLVGFWVFNGYIPKNWNTNQLTGAILMVLGLVVYMYFMFQIEVSELSKRVTKIEEDEYEF